MYILNITFVVEEELLEQWKDWLDHDFLPATINSSMFSGYQINQILRVDETHGVHFALQLHTDSPQNLALYEKTDAVKLPDTLKSTFGDKVMMFSTLMQVMQKG